MSKGGPTSQLIVELSRHFIKNRFGTTSFVVIGPAPNDRVELTNQPSLRTTAIIADNLFQVSQMAFDSCFGGFNQRTDVLRPPEINIPLVCPGFVLAYPILLDVKAQKIKPGLTLVFVESMGDMGFTGIELQSDFA